MTSVVQSRAPIFPPYAETGDARMHRKDDTDIVRFLSDASLGKRNNVLEQLRLSLQVAGGRQPFANPRLVFHGLAVALGDETWDTRYQCVKLVGELIPLLSPTDLDTCVNVALVPLVSCLGDAKMTVGMAAGQTLGLYAERTQDFRHFVDVVVKHGLEVHDHVTRKGVLINLSYLIVPEQRNSDFRPFVTSLVSQLFDGRVADSRPSVINCLEKISKLVGPKRFDSYLSSVPPAHRENYFRLLNDPGSASVSRSRDSSSAVDGFVFGVVPRRVVESLDQGSDSRSRVIASEELRHIVESSNPRSLRPHVSKFFEYITTLLEDIDNFQVTTTLLETMSVVVSGLEYPAVSCLPAVVLAMTQCMPDTNLVVRGAMMRLAMEAMRSAPPSKVVQVVLENLSSRNPRVRQSSIDVVTAALLTHPSDAFDLAALCPIIARGVVDQKKLVRQAALECMAVISQLLGNGKLPLISSVDRLELDGNGTGAMAAVQARLARRRLPAVDKDGLVQYVQLTSSSASSGSHRDAVGADAAWIESAASGSGMTFRTGYGDTDLQRQQSKSDDAWSTRSARSITPRRHLSSGKNLSKMPWERAVEELNIEVPPPAKDWHSEQSLSSDLDRQELAEPPYSNRSVNAWEARSARPRKPSSQLPGLTPSAEAGLPPSESETGDLGPADSKDDMNSSLRQIRNSATKKQLDKLFDRNGSLDSITGIANQRDQTITGNRSNADLQLFGRDEDSSDSGIRSDGELSSKPRSKRSVARHAEHAKRTERVSDHRFDEDAPLPSRFGEYQVPGNSDVERQWKTFPVGHQHNLGPLTVVGNRRPPLVPRNSANGGTKKAAAKRFKDTNHDDSTDGGEDTPLVVGKRASKRNSAPMRLSSATDSENPDSWQPFREPHKILDEAIQQLAQDDWECKCEGLTAIRRLAAFHDSLLSTQLHSVNLAVIAEVKNLRSQVSQNAMVCLGDMFRYMKKNMDPDLDKTVAVLLVKTGDSNKFIRETAEKSLVAMVENVSAHRALGALISAGTSQRSVTVRNTAAHLLSGLVEAMGGERILREFPDRVLPVAAQFVMDGSQETRYSGQKMLYTMMSTSPDEFERALNKHVAPNVLRNIHDKLDALRKRGLGEPPSGMTVSRLRRTPSDTKGFLRSYSAGREEQPSQGPVAPQGVTSLSAGAKKRSARVDDATLAELQSIESKLASSDWKERLTGVEQLTDMVRVRPGVVQAQITKVFGKFIPCLRDPNSKVNVSALLAMKRMTPGISGGMSNVIGHTVQTVVSNLASANAEIRTAAEEVLDSFMENIDSTLLLQPFIAEAQKSKPQVKAELTERITFLVTAVYSSRPSYVTSHALPFLWHLLGVVASNVGSTTRLRETTVAYVESLHLLLGNDLLVAAAANSSVTRPMHDLLNEIMETT